MSFIIAQLDYDYPDNKIEKIIIEQQGGTLISSQLRDEDEIVEFAKDADGLIVQYANITQAILEKLPKCKVVGRYGIGVDNIDVDAARSMNIKVVNNPEYCIDEVSDHALAFIMSLHRQIGLGTTQVRSGIWDFTKLTPIKATKDTVIGFVGFGKTAQALARKLNGIGFIKFVAYDPFLNREVFKQLNVKSHTLEEVMKNSDIISIHSALTQETKNMISKNLIEMMKPTAFLINTSRGGVVDNEALFLALENNIIRGAGLDVLDVEPPLSFDKIKKLDNLYITPHIAFYSETSIIELRTSIAEQVVQVVKGEKPKFSLF
ncbi:MAG: C-terminal binding protein [Bacteroidia bacterium]|nr:C-terminal binding protein [Bacteroidia bacterium]